MDNDIHSLLINGQVARDGCMCDVVWACAYTKYFKFLFLSRII
jgi:hypothetical protein